MLVRSQSRRYDAVVARTAMAYILRRWTPLSFPQIAQIVTPGRSHTSVVSMTQRVEAEGKGLRQGLSDTERVVATALAALLKNSTTLASYPSWRRARVAANLRRAVDLAREYEGAMGRSLSGCAAYLRDVAARGIDSKEADILGEDDDMVRVMTVHSAKGLEFPIVAVTGLDGQQFDVALA